MADTASEISAVFFTVKFKRYESPWSLANDELSITMDSIRRNGDTTQFKGAQMASSKGRKPGSNATIRSRSCSTICPNSPSSNAKLSKTKVARMIGLCQKTPLLLSCRKETSFSSGRKSASAASRPASAVYPGAMSVETADSEKSQEPTGCTDSSNPSSSSTKGIGTDGHSSASETSDRGNSGASNAVRVSGNSGC